MRQSIFFSSHPWELFFCDVLYCMFCVLWCCFPYVCFRPVTGSVWTFLIFVRVSFPFSLSLVYSVCIGTFVVKALLRHFTNTRTNFFPDWTNTPLRIPYDENTGMQGVFMLIHSKKWKECTIFAYQKGNLSALYAAEIRVFVVREHANIYNDSKTIDAFIPCWWYGQIRAVFNAMCWNTAWYHCWAELRLCAMCINGAFRLPRWENGGYPLFVSVLKCSTA